MTDKYQEWLKIHNELIDEIWEAAPESEASFKEYFMNQLNKAVSASERKKTEAVVDAVFQIEDESLRAEVLNEMLVIKEHCKHQEITRELQNIGHPSSVKYIDLMLKDGFEHLAYNGSESDVIAKWFSHALKSIGTEDAIAVIAKYSQSNDKGMKWSNTTGHLVKVVKLPIEVIHDSNKEEKEVYSRIQAGNSVPDNRTRVFSCQGR